jgi:tetratricopeptide (TPR) repeat protein
MVKLKILILCLVLLLTVTSALGQDTVPIPASFQLSGFTHIPQLWNNCGPATLTTALTHYGYVADQTPAANWLKPNTADGNVSPWQMVEYVNTQAGGTTRALWRYGGTLERAKTLIANGFPVIIEEGFEPYDHQGNYLGWMGHYLLLTGYDDMQQAFTAQDSYIGPNQSYTYAHVDEFWKHFNRVYIVIYDASQEPTVLSLLGTDADPQQNAVNALEAARAEALADPNDQYAWFNMGTNFVALGMFPEAATAYDQARMVGGGLPWRMLWYQFGPYEAYNTIGRYQDTFDLAAAVIANSGTARYIEETYYYAGVAREAVGETARALDNYRAAVELNSNYIVAIEARDRLEGTTG